MSDPVTSAATARGVSIEVGQSCPPGLPGKSAYEIASLHGFSGSEGEWVSSLSSAELSVTASVAISASIAVAALPDGSFAPADSSEASTWDGVLGVSVDSAAAGDIVVLRPSGVIDADFDFTPGNAVYLGVGGQLVQQPPTSGAIIQIGVAVREAALFVNIHPPIILEP